MNELALFAGAGGGILGGKLLGWRTVCAVEIDKYARSVLVARQGDGSLPPFPIWDDVRTFDGSPWRGIVDVVSGGFPCQDISAAGKGEGIQGPRSGLWREMLRIIREVRPRYAFVENVPTLTRRGLGTVLGGLAQAGYDAEWGCLPASAFGAWHKRDRIWILAADADRERESQSQGSEPEERGWASDGDQAHADADGKRCEELRGAESVSASVHPPGRNRWWATEPGMVRVVHGLANRVDRIRCLGNGQVPIVAASAFQELRRRISKPAKRHA